MPIVRQIIQSLSKEEARAFKIFLNRIQTQTDRKVEQLFDAYRNAKADAIDDSKLIRKMFGTDNRNAYYQLRNRLREYIDRSLNDFYFGREEVYLLQLIGLGRMAFQRQQYVIGWDYLKRARKIALQEDQLDLADLVLGEMIKIAVFVPGTNPEELIEERSSIRKKLQALRELDEILTVLGYRLAISQQTGKSDEGLNATLESVLSRYLQDEVLRRDATFRVRLMEGVCQVLLQKHAYAAMADYLGTEMPPAIAASWFGKAQHETKLKLLTWWTNSLFKAGRLKDSLRVSDLLRLAMDEYDGFLADKYFIFYNSARVYVNSVLNLPEAIRILEEILANTALEKHPLYSLLVHLNLSLCLYETGDLKKALRVLSRLYVHPAYPQADAIFRFKIGISEIILRATQEQWETIGHRTLQLAKDLQQVPEDFEGKPRLSSFLKIMASLARRDGDVSKVLRTQIDEWIKTHGATAIESDVINYTSWLKSRYASGS
jgi:hypothetical protein